MQQADFNMKLVFIRLPTVRIADYCLLPELKYFQGCTDRGPKVGIVCRLRGLAKELLGGVPLSNEGDGDSTA